ncbi:HAMP domain-containing histidine kinase [Clostridium sp. 19966]|uniref:sensor histidine kinase n=1 Tax=Clostridium sp. 19966 TaxID=2768166 RepID=UPI0028DFD77B|nr:HAMP domain-containing sensor histidine kinase [Clostridium sp. 19966]MDT8716358.1 HAMP domain-containing histidine kinase [Clostridium sp. 19966]
MKGSISKKLFIVTAIFLSLFILLTMLFQSMFFEKFYMNMKLKAFSSNVQHLYSTYSDEFKSGTELMDMMKEFEVKNNATIVILDSQGVPKYSTSNIQEDDTSKSNTIIKILYEWYYVSSKSLNDIKSSKKVYTTMYNDPDFNTNNIICVVPPLKSTDTDLVVAVSSLQPIQEASGVIKLFYVYIFIAMLFLILILSRVYSNMISKPLVKLNNTAVKMADMDFQIKCDVKSDDELGSLANALNFLSARLGLALKDLQERNTQLEKDIEKERNLERMRKEFVAGVSHELKTPISLISGYAEGLKDNIVDDESKDFYIEVIMDEANKMNSLVKDMLDLSQLESGSFKLVPENFYIDKLLKMALNKHSQFISQKNINLNVSIEEETLVYGDPKRIEQVITNFLTNAVRHCDENGIMKVNSYSKDDKLIVEIENSGENIPEEDLENIWDKFYKVDKSRIRIAGGTGLGLSIVKNILLLHNSTFGVQNRKHSVCFYFSLNKVKELSIKD